MLSWASTQLLFLQAKNLDFLGWEWKIVLKNWWRECKMNFIWMSLPTQIDKFWDIGLT